MGIVASSMATGQHSHKESNLTKGGTHTRFFQTDTNLFWKHPANKESKIKVYRKVHGRGVEKVQLIKLVDCHINPAEFPVVPKEMG